MIIHNLRLEGAFLAETTPFVDKRGAFSRLFSMDELSNILSGRQIDSINLSKTTACGTVRGLHFQYPPKSEMKLARCLRGAVFDVIVDIRANSPTFLQWLGVELSESNMKMIVIPEGFAHGFQTLCDNSEMLYLHTESYQPGFEGALNYRDPALNVQWPLAVTEISDKDNATEFIDNNFKGVKL